MSESDGPRRGGGAPPREPIWRWLPALLGEVLWWLRWPLVFGVVALLTYQVATSDPTPGLDYASGDKPREMGQSICGADTGPCPPTGFKWTVPASGVVQTRFEREDTDERTELRGWARLKGWYLHDFQDCPAVTEWSLVADGEPMSQGRIVAGVPDQDIAGTAPREARAIVFTIRRTDSLACGSIFQWIYAGLD